MEASLSSYFRMKLRVLGVVTLAAFMCSTGFASRQGTSTWSDPLISLRYAAGAEISNADEALLASLAVYNDSSYKQDVALLIILAKTRSSVARNIARRILDGEFRRNEKRYTDKWLALNAARAISVAGDSVPLLGLLGTPLHVGATPNLVDAWAVAMNGDFRLGDVFMRKLKGDEPGRPCEAMGYAGPFLSNSSGLRDELMSELLRRLSELDSENAGCAAQALQEHASILSTVEVARVIDRTEALIDGSDVRRQQVGVALATTLMSNLPDEHLASAILRLSTEPSNAEVRIAAASAAKRVGLSIEPLPVAVVSNLPFGDVEPMPAGTAVGVGLKPAEFLLSHAFEDGWSFYFDELNEPEMIELLELIAKRDGRLTDRVEKLRHLLGHQRFQQSYAARLVASAELGQERPQETRALLEGLFQESNALQRTTLAVRFPDVFPRERVESAWKSALTSEKPWLHLAALSNAARLCNVKLAHLPAELRSDASLKTYSDELESRIAECSAIPKIKHRRVVPAAGVESKSRRCGRVIGEVADCGWIQGVN